MKTFSCECGELVFFENVACVVCGKELGFLPDALLLSSLEPAENGLFKVAEAKAGKRLYKKCQNYAKEAVCNWMIPLGTRSGQENASFCASCRLNQTIPDLTRKQNHTFWHRMEIAKRRLVYTLLSFKLPIANKADDPRQGLAFSFLEDQLQPDGSVVRVMTGHDNGLITLNIAEADDSVREKIRLAMGEPYRTLLGHFRHEIGHYYWDRLVRGTKFMERCRGLFGNEETDYEQALKQYYSRGAPANWQENFISAYATAHPLEDWAESWAHFMHIQDALEVANDFGLVGKSVCLDPKRVGPLMRPEPLTFEGIIGAWAELSIAWNSMNRSMGLQDPYPFVLAPATIGKLKFIYDVISSRSTKSVRSAYYRTWNA